MKRVLILFVPCLTAVLLFSTFASGQTALKVGSKVSAKATPKNDTKRPHTFTIRGSVTPTSRPVKCAAGVTNIRYCSPAKAADVCKGKVRVTIKRGVRAIARKNVKLSPTTCKYSARIKMTKRQKHGKLTVISRFLGNGLVTARNSPAVKVKV